jgi:hypothetical protein
VRKRICKACDRCRLKISKVCASRTEGEMATTAKLTGRV